jgi:signal transduction histidine kinase
MALTVPIVNNEIRVLLLEDSQYDEELIRYALQQENVLFNLKRVDTEAAFVKQISESPPDLILSDFSLPGFDGMRALALAREKCPEVPFIFVTGTLGEEVAIETLKKGATDYVLKHRLSRLVPSVHRALREAREREDRKRAQQQLRESYEQLRSLSVHLQSVREEERTRIAREVHDELGQALTGLKLQLTWLAGRLPKRSKLLRDKARSLTGNVDATIQAMRRIATALRPGILDTAGLLAALEWQAQDFESQTGIKCTLQTSLQDTEWNQDLNTAFFRIFQETLTNVIRHAKATAVQVRFFEERDDLILEIHDNGVGIAEKDIRNTQSIGLLGMRERAALLRGEVHWRGAPGKGTTVTVRIPRPENKPMPDRLQLNENTPDRRPRRRAPRVKAYSR